VLIVYVDDIIVTENDEEVRRTQRLLDS